MRSDRPRRSDFGTIWVKEGTTIKAHRVHTGVNDGLNVEITGKINVGDEVVLGSNAPPTAQTTQQQQPQNPFAPQMPRGAGGRGGR